MRLVVIGESDVHRLLPTQECIEVMRAALEDLARGDVFQPLRSIVRPPGAKGFLGLMPTYRGGANPAFAVKEVCVFPGNPVIGLDTHLGAVLLHSPHTGQLQAIVNAAAVTARRTAAVTALATRTLARSDAATLAIVGTGTQARTHLEALLVVRDFQEIRIAGKEARQAEAFVDRYGGPGVRACRSVEEAVGDADVVVTVTSAVEPVLRRDWIRAGTHINLVGSSVATAREADGATMAAATIFVDRRESAIHESGDYLFALREGAIGPDAIRAELGEVLIGTAQGRTSDEEITIFKSLGLAIEDLAAAQYLYEKAQSSGAGQWIEFD